METSDISDVSVEDMLNMLILSAFLPRIRFRIWDKSVLEPGKEKPRRSNAAPGPIAGMGYTMVTNE